MKNRGKDSNYLPNSVSTVQTDPEPTGYRRPPTRSRFKPGQSGNPKGRPKRRKNIAAQLQKIFVASVTVREGTRTSKVPRIVALVRRLLDGGLKGEQRALELCLRLARDIGVLQTTVGDLPDGGIAILSDEELTELERLYAKMAGLDQDA